MRSAGPALSIQNQDCACAVWQTGETPVHSFTSISSDVFPGCGGAWDLSQLGEIKAGVGTEGPVLQYAVGHCLGKRVTHGLSFLQISGLS